jgi:hypothetical protein
MKADFLITSEQVRAARALIRWEQRDLAETSKVSLPSIKRLETTPGPLAAQARTVEALRAALESAGVEFLNHDQPGVRLRQGFLLDGGENGYRDLRGIEFGARDGANVIRVLVTDEALEIYDSDSTDRMDVFNRFRTKIVKVAQSKYSMHKLPNGHDQLIIDSSDVN